MLNCEDILSKFTSFPTIVDKTDAQVLKDGFEFDKKVLNEQECRKDIKYRYKKNIDGSDYILIEEYFFKDNETSLDLRNALGTNYYLNKL